MSFPFIVCFLQNAWSSSYVGRNWPRHSWLRALGRSRSGLRLGEMLANLDVCENTTLAVGKSASSKLPPDRRHIQSILRERSPDVVIACGAQAEQALLEVWRGPLLAVPHPASRVVTNELYSLARRLLPEIDRRLSLRQRPGSIDCERLDGDIDRNFRVPDGDYAKAASLVTLPDLVLFESLCRKRAMPHEAGILRAELAERLARKGAP